MTTDKLRQFTLVYPDGFEETVYYRSDALPESLEAAGEQLLEDARAGTARHVVKPSQDQLVSDGVSSAEIRDLPRDSSRSEPESVAEPTPAAAEPPPARKKGRSTRSPKPRAKAGTK